MVLGKIIQVLGKNWPHPLSHGCAPVCALRCWALPASLLPSLKERALSSHCAALGHWTGHGNKDGISCVWSTAVVFRTSHLPPLPSPRITGGAHRAKQLHGLCWSLESSSQQSSSPAEPRCECVWDSAEELLGPSCLPELLSGEVKDNGLRQSVMDGRARPEIRRWIALLSGGVGGRLKGRGSAFPGAVQTC